MKNIKTPSITSALIINTLLCGNTIFQHDKQKNALVFCSTPTSLDQQIDLIDSKKFTILDLNNKNPSSTYVQQVVLKNLTTNLFDRNGQLNPNVEHRWKMITKNENVFNSLKNIDAYFSNINNNPQSVDQLNEFLVNNLAQNGNYSKKMQRDLINANNILKENEQEFFPYLKDTIETCKDVTLSQTSKSFAREMGN